MPLEIDTGPLPNLETLAVDLTGQTATVSLNRPHVNNAVNQQMTSDYERLIPWLAGHGDEVRVVILTGNGNAFCAGDDLKELATLSAERARQLMHRQARLYLAFEQLPQPIIAAVNSTGALAYTMQQAQEASSRAISALDRVPDSSCKAALIQLADFAVERRF